jgi:PLD-like domain
VLDPRDRRLLLQALTPPDGFELDHAIGTSYSLDLMALLAAPLAFSPFAEADTPETDPLVLLEALQASAERVTLFCAAGHTYAPPADQFLLAHLEDSVVECLAPLGGAFHPKIWVLRFTKDEHVAFRFLCLSRNLTFDRCWDTALVLDGYVKGRSRAANRPLADFIRALEEMAQRPLTERQAQALERLARDVLHVDWELPAPFESFAFHPLGHRGAPSKWPLDGKRIDRLLVISPFVSDTLLAKLTSAGDRHVLVSRPDQLDACECSALDAFADIYVLDDAASDEPVEECSAASMRGLHAKTYVADQGWDATTWTGSANATTSAFARNVEFLVELKGKRSEVGIDACLRVASEHEVSFRSLLTKYFREEGASVELAAKRELERDADRMRRNLAVAGLRLRVEGPRDDVYDMALEVATSVDTIASLLSLSAWPVTRTHDSGAERVDLMARPLARFKRLPLDRITTFVAFRAVFESGDTSATEDFVLNPPLVDAPPERRAHLVRAMLSNRAEVLRYFLYLLSGDSIEAVRSLGDLGSPQTGTGGPERGRAGRPLALPLLESLLRALDRDPAKLASVKRIVDDLTATEEGALLLPEDWQEIWAPVSSVADGRTK